MPFVKIGHQQVEEVNIPLEKDEEPMEVDEEPVGVVGEPVEVDGEPIEDEEPPISDVVVNEVGTTNLHNTSWNLAKFNNICRQFEI